MYTEEVRVRLAPGVYSGFIRERGLTLSVRGARDHQQVGPHSIFFFREMLGGLIFFSAAFDAIGGRGIFSDVEQAFCLGTYDLRGGEAGKKTKMTLDAGGKSVSVKPQATPGLQEPLLEIKK